MTWDPVKLGTILDHRHAIDRVAHYIDNNLDAELSVDALAEVASLSKFHLHDVLRTHVGLTPIQMVTEARLVHAARRLKNARPGTLKIIDVALDVGFSNASSFTRGFRQRFGASPVQMTRSALSETPWFDVGCAVKRPIQSAARRVNVSPRYLYGHIAEDGRGRSFVRQAPQVYEAVFDVVKRLGIQEAGRPVGFPVGSAWVPVDRLQLMCSFSSKKRLSLPHLTETFMPGGRYICLHHIGPYESRWQAWTKLATLRGRFRGGADGRRPFEVERTDHTDPQAVPQAMVYFPI